MEATKTQFNMRNLLAFAGIVAILHCATAQTVNGTSATATFSGLDKAGASASIKPMVNGVAIGEWQFKGNGKGKTEIYGDFTPSGITKFTMNLYSGTTKVASVPMQGGPSPIELTITERLVNSEEVCADDEWWPVFVAAYMVISCAHVSYHSETVNGQTNSTFDASWDCAGMTTVSTGSGLYNNVSRIEFVSGNGNGTMLKGVNALGFSGSAGGVVTSVR